MSDRSLVALRSLPVAPRGHSQELVGNHIDQNGSGNVHITENSITWPTDEATETADAKVIS